MNRMRHLRSRSGRRALFLALVIVARGPGPGAGLSAAEPQVFFSSEEGVQERLVQCIEESRRTIDVAMFDVSAAPLVRALRRVAERRVQVRLLLDAHALRENPSLSRIGDAVALRSLHGQRGRGGFMHHKFAVFDGSRVVTGSYNWTVGAERANFENALMLDDPFVVQAYAREFSRLWAVSTSRNDGSLRRTPRPPRRIVYPHRPHKPKFHKVPRGRKRKARARKKAQGLSGPNFIGQGFALFGI